MFTAERILRLCQRADPLIVNQISAALELSAVAFEVTTPLRSAHFMGQIAYESAGLTRFVENLDYSPGRVRNVFPSLAPRSEALAHHPEALANAAYAFVLGNGDEHSGDGWRFRGRGIIQITGRGNYSFFGAAAGVDILAEPDLAEQPAAAVRVALAFWKSRKCNAKADLDDVDQVTVLINGSAMAGLVERRALTERAKAIFTKTEPLIA